jgi:hypothetical protein
MMPPVDPFYGECVKLGVIDMKTVEFEANEEVVGTTIAIAANLELGAIATLHPPSTFNPQAPLLSFGIPVRNAEHTLPRLLDSLLAQDFPDFEIVISDNASTDGTIDVCRAYAHRDSRVRFYQNPKNLGINANFNRVLELARGKYFRWIGSDDWVEPSYASECLKQFQSRPDAFGVTTYQDHIDDEGVLHYCEFPDRRPDSNLPHVRIQRMLWFLTSDYRYIDPMYTMVRREPLLNQTRLSVNVIEADRLMAVEMSLLGSFAHVPQCLAHRRVPSITTHHALLQRCYGENYSVVKHQNLVHLSLACWQRVQATPMAVGQKVICAIAIFRFLIVRLFQATIFHSTELIRPVARPVKHRVVGKWR